MNFSIAGIYILFLEWNTVYHVIQLQQNNAFRAAAMFSPCEKKSSALHARMGT